MDINEILKEIEEREKDNVPTFKAFTPKRKMSLLKKDIEAFIKARRQANYYHSITNDSNVFQEAYGRYHFLELSSSTRARLRVQSLDDNELHMYVNMLEDNLARLKKARGLGYGYTMYEFITSGCVFASGVENEVIKNAIQGIRNQCDEITANAIKE